jgi:hypothetical protein
MNFNFSTIGSILFLLPFAMGAYYKPYPDVGLHESSYQCVLDPKVTTENFGDFVDMIQGMWSSSCGRNRGIFVLDPPDGHTYDCGNFPKAWNISSAGDLTDLTKGHTVEQAIYALDQFIRSVYAASTDKDIGACDFETLSMFLCGREDPWRSVPWVNKLQNQPIRGVNIGGLFMLERWITPNLLPWGDHTGIVDQYTFSQNCSTYDLCDIIYDHWHNWYTQEDFLIMKRNKLNTIRLPLGYWYFEELSGFPAYPYLLPRESILDGIKHLI